jgi:integrase
VKPLTDLEIRRAKKQAKPYRLYDGNGLTLYIPTTDVRSWQLRYKHDGREQTFTLGRLADMDLAGARKAAAKARAAVEEGAHLTVEKRIAKVRKVAATAMTFEKVSSAWADARARKMKWTPDYKAEVKASLDRHLADLMPLPVDKINATITAPMIDAVDRTAPEMAKKVEQRLVAIFDYALRRGLVPANPLPRPERTKTARRHLPAITDRKAVGTILRAADIAECFRGVRRAHWLATLTAQRLGSIMLATWDQFDLDAALWRIPRPNMKRKDEARGDHVVPIGPRTVAMLREWRQADGDNATIVCPARSGDRAITHEAVEKWYRRSLGLSGQHSPHSWRSVFKSWAADAGKDFDATEAHLDHGIGDKTAQSYDRAQRLELRRELATWYEAQVFVAREQTGGP